MKNYSQKPNSKVKLSLLLGSSALAGLTVAGLSLASTASASTTPTPAASTPSPSETPWHSNTDPAHEATELAAQKATEANADAKGVEPDGTKWGHDDVDGPEHDNGKPDGDHTEKWSESGAHESEETADPETSDAPQSPTTSASPSS